MSTPVLGHVTFLPSGIKAPLDAKSVKRSLLELAIRHKVPIANVCGGGASCGTCRVFVQSGVEIEPRQEPEQAMADDRGFKPLERLACQISPVPGLIVEIQDEGN